ncbi:MAG: acyltransferase family protein [Flavobacteriales bacterium]
MRLEQLTFTRFIAAISIVIFHYGLNVDPFCVKPFVELFQEASIGVSYFFVLSGFIMIVAYWNKNEITFYEYIKRRFARLYPVYFLAILILLAYYIRTQITIPFDEVILGVLLMQSWLPEYALSFNWPGWSLSVELLFYLCFPFIFNQIVKKKQFKYIAIVSCVIFITSQFAVHLLKYSNFYQEFPSANHNFVFYFPLLHLNEFVMGILFGVFFMKNKRSTKNYDVLILLLFIVLLVLIYFNNYFIFHNGLLVFLYIPIIYCLVYNNGLITTLFNKRIFILLGEISYAVYILQKPIYMFTKSFMISLGVNNRNITFYFFLLVLLIVSYFSYKYVEQPLRKLINKINIPSYLNKKK